MKQVEVTLDALDRISGLRNGNEMEMIKAGIADSYATLSELINAGRDEETIAVWTDDLLKVMFVLSDYNALVNSLQDVPENRFGAYRYEDLRGKEEGV